MRKVHKMGLIALLVGLAAGISGCVGLPAPPQGQIYLHWNDIALCSDLQTGNACPSIPMSSTNKYYMFSPQVWKATQDYIDALRRYAQHAKTNGEENFFSSSAENEALIEALFQVKTKMHLIDESFQKNKK